MHAPLQGVLQRGGVGLRLRRAVHEEDGEREKFGDAKTLWIYTGCLLETDLKAESRWRTEVTDEMLSLTDVLVDGPFLEAKKDISLQFRGSSNQRIIHLR